MDNFLGLADQSEAFAKFLTVSRKFGLTRVRNLVVSDYARKPKVPGSSLAASHAQRWALCSNQLANV